MPSLGSSRIPRSRSLSTFHFPNKSIDTSAEERFCLYSTEVSYDDPDSDLDYTQHILGDPAISNRQPLSNDRSRSRTPSSSCPSAAYSPPKLPRQLYRFSRDSRYLRLMNRTTRCLIIAIVVFFSLFIISLIRASQVDNWKLENGHISILPAPPPTWEQFVFLTRYYGGLATVIPSSESTPEWPPREPGENPVISREWTHDNEWEAMVPESPSHGDSKPFHQHPQSVLTSEGPGLNECFLDVEETVRIPSIRYYDGKPAGFPEPAIGSYEELDIPSDICFERYGRFAPYGLGYSVQSGGLGTGLHGDRNGSDFVWETGPPVDYRLVDWAAVQRQCYRANAGRFSHVPSRISSPNGFYIHEHSQTTAFTSRTDTSPVVGGGDRDTSTSSTPKQPLDASAHVLVPRSASANAGPANKTDDETGRESGKLSRTAVVVRIWDEFNWRADDITNLRALISELSLASHGRYDVHLLVQVKNDAAHPIWADREVYVERVNTVPAEFRGLVTLWTETQMLSLYQGLFDLFSRGDGLPVHGSYRGLSMALQYFGYNHPEYDFFWRWEMDARYIGHYLDLFTKFERWSRNQPRKALWERNERFFIPAVHGSWDDFKQLAKVQGEMADGDTDKNRGRGGGRRPAGKPKDAQPMGDEFTTASSGPLVWGPVRSSSEEDWFETENDPMPPTQGYQSDYYKWGIGEEADLIALYPIFDPEGTTWLLKDDITGYKGAPPRRAHMLVSSRLSRRLLLAMHRETAFAKHFAFPEMWAATVALQHSFKAISAPQPIYIDRAWPVQYLGNVINGGRSGSSGGSPTSVFGHREHNLRGLSWFYDSPFPSRLYRRWMGLLAEDSDGGHGGDKFETAVDSTRAELVLKSGSSNAASAKLMAMPGGEGRMCLPPMLLHPVKDIELPVVDEPEEESANEPHLDLAS